MATTHTSANCANTSDIRSVIAKACRAGVEMTKICAPLTKSQAIFQAAKASYFAATAENQNDNYATAGRLINPRLKVFCSGRSKK